jgi:hypothetical protein
MFEGYPTYPRYRALRRLPVPLVGEDVYALQTTLKGLGFSPGVLDGVFGGMTESALREAQRQLRDLVVDGVAGPATQRRLLGSLCARVRLTFNLPDGLPVGQVGHECGFIIGNYSPRRPNLTYDAGPAQRNTQFVHPKDGFDAPASVRKLAQNTREHYDLFAGLGTRRRWELAAGAWNAPAFACYIAREEGASGVSKARTARPSAESRVTFERYIDYVTAALKL